MIVCRTFTLLFLMCVTACGVCSSLFPIFRRSYSVPSTSFDDESSAVAPVLYNSRESVYYWYSEKTTSGAYPRLSYRRSYNNARECDTDKMYFVVSAALSTAGASLSGLACVMAASWVYAGFDSCLHSFIVFVTFLAFACYVVVAALMANVYMNGSCTGSWNSVAALKHDAPGYSLVEGFMLLCVAAGGMLIALVLEILSFCVCTSTDDYAGGSRSRAVSGDQHALVLSEGSVVLVEKAAHSDYHRTDSGLSRQRGEGSMLRRSSSAGLPRSSSSAGLPRSGSSASFRRSNSSSSIDSSQSSRSGMSSSSGASSRSSRSGHRRPLR